MISKETFTPQWIDTFRQQEQYRRVNPALFEKMVYAFALLESLAKTDFDFIFKGGTSIILMSVSTNRFSIDIDIILLDVLFEENPYEELTQADIRCPWLQTSRRDGFLTHGPTCPSC